MCYKLCPQAVRARITLFKIRPKLHQLWHLATSIRCLNPKIVSCMADESFMGTVTKIAKACHLRTANLQFLGLKPPSGVVKPAQLPLCVSRTLGGWPRTMHRRVLERWRQHLHGRLHLSGQEAVPNC